MFARLWALVCLTIFGLSVGRSEPVASTDPVLVVYLRTAPGQSTSPLDFMKRELRSLMKEAGYQVEFRVPAEAPAESHSAAIAIVELNGNCEVVPPRELATARATVTTLASTPVIDGNVLPFSRVQCGAVGQFVAPSLALRAAFDRELLYGRALARLVAHELYHVLTNEQGHDRAGVAKPAFTAHDLLAERFDFEREAIRRFRAQVRQPQIPQSQFVAHAQSVGESDLGSK